MLTSTAPSSARRCAASMLVLWPIWLVLFIVIMTLIGTTSTDLLVGNGGGLVPHNDKALGLTAWIMMSAWVLIMVLFLVFADLMFLSTHTYVNSIYDLRRLRSINLGFSIAALLMFPPLAVVGIPLTLTGLSRHRTKAPKLFGWSAACGSTALICVIIATLVIAIAASVEVVRTQDEPCYTYETTTTEWFEGITTTTLAALTAEMTTSSAAALTMANITDTGDASATTANFAMSSTTAASMAAWDPTVLQNTTSWTATTTTGPSWCGPGVTSTWIQSLLVASTDATAAAIVFSCLFALAQILFVAFVDTMILGLLPSTSTPGQVQQTSAPGNNTLVHPCPNCSTPLQFTRTGPTTMVQCFSCSATVEFATK